MSELCAKNCKFCVPFLQILCNISTHFFYGTIVCDTGVLSRVSWLVGPLKLRVTIQLTLSLGSYLPSTEVQMTSCKKCLLFTFVKEN